MFLPAGPLLVAAQLPDSTPGKKSALAYGETYEKANGAGSTNTFGGHMWDAGQLVVAALPVALKREGSGCLARRVQYVAHRPRRL
ncbi:hypothetical protein G6F24_018522 [Rhizopus arrhizus]|nr:hypothetical protein G6F24_018522 [Rhizopus arrhizus]